MYKINAMCIIVIHQNLTKQEKIGKDIRMSNMQY
jgi:hypothetical protein